MAQHFPSRPARCHPHLLVAWSMPQARWGSGAVSLTNTLLPDWRCRSSQHPKPTADRRRTTGKVGRKRQGWLVFEARPGVNEPSHQAVRKVILPRLSITVYLGKTVESSNAMHQAGPRSNSESGCSRLFWDDGFSTSDQSSQQAVEHPFRSASREEAGSMNDTRSS